MDYSPCRVGNDSCRRKCRGGEAVSKRKQNLPMPVRNYRDTVFRMLFREKNELLSLFNTVNGTSYEEPEKLQITTLENAIYMSMKNDISCILDMKLNLYEHQSTVNPNMPLRNLFYVARLFEVLTKDQDLYTGKKILLPIPKFIVLYNGREPQPERREFRLSDSFIKKQEKVYLELLVVQLNINPGYNTELVANCQTLLEYVQYTERIRSHSRNLPLEEAVEKAVTECIKEGILSDFLRKNRSEVVPMSIFEYDEEKHMQALRNAGFEDGLEQGIEQGLEQGIEQGAQTSRYQIICNMLRNQLSPELISRYTEQPLEYIFEVEREMHPVVRE